MSELPCADDDSFCKGCLGCSQEITFNVDGISLLEKGEKPDEGLAKDLGE